MKEKYFYLLMIFAFLLTANTGYAQLNNEKTKTIQNIDGLSIYPNPVSNGKIYISTKLNLVKEVRIYDVLGKNILSETLLGKELNISKLTPGVYILKIKEEEFTATRKLVIK